MNRPPCVSFDMPRPHPRPTLFPYTTLFRSADLPGIALGGASAAILGGFLGFVAGSFVMVATRSDRKSTRLNSSHVSISYAVSCLKKKKVRQLRLTPASV